MAEFYDDQLELMEDRFYSRKVSFNAFVDGLDIFHDGFELEKANEKDFSKSIDSFRKDIEQLKSDLFESESSQKYIRNVDSKYASPARSQLGFPDFFTVSSQSAILQNEDEESFMSTVVTEFEDFEDIALVELRNYFEQCKFDNLVIEKEECRILFSKFKYAMGLLYTSSIILAVYSVL